MPRRVVKEDPHKINGRIEASSVRLVGDNIEQGLYDLQEALKIAEAKDLDLVEVSDKADPPICKVMDYKKFLYEHKKKQKKIKANASKMVVKELRFGPNTDEHDFNFKLKHGIKFLKDGSKLKAYVFFKGRSIVYKDKGEILLLKLAQELEEVGIVEQMPSMMGKRMIMLIVPKKK